MAALVLLFAPTVGASSEAEDEAYRLYKSAAEDFKTHDFEAAVDKLTQAYALFPKPIILMKKAEALEHLGRIEAAHEAFIAVASEDKRMADKVQSSIRRLEVMLAKPVQVSVQSGDVTGARIVVDGKDTGRVTPSVLELVRGPHAIEVTKDGYHAWESEGFVAAGVATLLVEATLRAMKGHARVRLAAGTFRTVKVAIDGAPVPALSPDETTSGRVPLEVGQHEMRCERDDGQSQRRTFDVRDGQDVELVCELLPLPDPTLDIIGWSLIGTGAVALAGGSWLLIDYFDELDFAESTQKDDDLRDDVRLVSNKQIFGPVLLGVGVAAAATGVVLLLIDPGGEDEARLLPGVAPTRTGGAFVLSGSF